MNFPGFAGRERDFLYMMVGLFVFALVGVAIYLAIRYRPGAREPVPVERVLSDEQLRHILDIVVARQRVPGDVTKITLPDGREVARLRSLGEEWQLKTRHRHRIFATDEEMRQAVRSLLLSNGSEKVTFHLANKVPMDLKLGGPRRAVTRHTE